MRNLARKLRHHWMAVVVLALFLGLGVTYSIVVPVFEASDELHHYPFVAHLARGGGLPIQRAGDQTLWEQEGSQPPLYYALAGRLTSWLPTDDLPIIYRLNPHARIGVPLAQDNKNLIVHTERESWPWSGAVLGVHLVRFFSLLLASGTVLCTYCIALAIFPRNRVLALAAMTLNSFIPMFIFISGSVNNDNLVAFLSSLTLLLLIRVIQRGASRRFLVLLGVVIGLGSLSKLSAVGLVPLAGLALLLRRFFVPQRYRATGTQPEEGSRGAGEQGSRFARTEGSQRSGVWQWVIDCAIMCVPIILIAGWWYLRNWQLYGDPTGIIAMLDIIGRRPSTPSLLDLRSEFEGFRINFWGLFGVVNVLLRPTWIYRVLDALTLIALAGVPVWIWRQRRARRPIPWPELALLATWVTAEFVLLIRWTMMTYASQGRLLFPALSAICLFLALGLLGWLPHRWQIPATGLLAAFFFTLSVTAPFTAIKPSYVRPPILTEADVPKTAQRFNATYGDTARLLAFDVDKKTVRPGELLGVTLYWQALRPTSVDFSIFLQLVTGKDQIIGQVDSYPGGGAYPTSMWAPGEVIRDKYVVPVNSVPNEPVAARLLVGLYRYETAQRLPAADPRREAVNPTVLERIKIAVPTPSFMPPKILDANLDNRVRLIGYGVSSEPVHPGMEVSLTLYWQVMKELDHDYTVFIHLLDEGEALVGQGDGPPMNDAYPSSFWAAGENLADGHRLRVFDQAKPGKYRIAVGFYDPVTAQRLPVLDTQGQIVGDRVIIGSLEVADRP